MVYVEKKVVDDAVLFKDEQFSDIRNQLCTFREGTETSDCFVRACSHAGIIFGPNTGFA